MSLRTLGERLYQARLRAGAARGRPITQREVGDTLGVHQVTVGEWERNQAEPSLERIALLAALYAVSPAWLAFGDGEDRIDETGDSGDGGDAGGAFGAPRRPRSPLPPPLEPEVIESRHEPRPAQKRRGKAG